MNSEDLYVVVGLDYEYDLGKIYQVRTTIIGIFQDEKVADRVMADKYTIYEYDDVQVRPFEGRVM